MHDAVADVLVERQRLARPNPAGFLISLALHAGLALVFVAAARSHRPTDLRPVLAVRFAPARPAATSVSTPAAPARPATRNEAPKPPEPEPKPEKKPAVPPVEKSLWGRSEKKPKEEPKEEAPSRVDEASTRLPGSPAGGAAGGAAGVPGIGMAGVAGLEGGDFPYTIYVDRMLTIIGRNWFRPQTKAEPIVQVFFTIERDGKIRDPQIEKSSGSAVFDRAALRAVIESSPLPPLPFGYSGSELGVHMTFH